MLEALRTSVQDSALEGRGRVTFCRCILSCTYGPRIAVAKRWSGEKRLYGTVESEVVISIRGKVTMTQPPYDLDTLLTNNLSPG